MFGRLMRICDSMLGRCMNCIRKSFLVATVAWVLHAISVVCNAGHWLTISVLIFAVVGTTLWVTHMAVFAFRIAANRIEPGSSEPQLAQDASASRRKFALRLAQAAGSAAVILISRSDALFAAGNCDCSKCTSNQVCCPTANGYCGCFPKGIRC